MPNTNPTIVSASLSDKELQDSINEMVANFDKGLQTMLEHSNEYVEKIQASLQKIGNTNFGAKGSNDGAVVKQTKAQNDFTDAVKKSTNEIKRQGKEGEMSFDQIASATTKAARSASVFIQNERENLRMRQNEIQARIDNLRKQFGNVEIKTIVRDDGTFSRAVDKAKQKIEEIRRQLQNVPPTSALGKQFSQELQTARNEYNELIRSRKAFEAKSQITSLASEYEQNNKKLRELATAYKQLYTDEKQAENAMNNGAVAIARYGDSAEKAQQKLLKASFNRAINILPQGDDLAYAKLERLRAILADHRFLGALSPSEIKRARAEVQKLESQLVDYISKINSSTQAQQQATNANSQQSRSIDEMNAYIRQNIQREQERRDAIRQTGLAAQDAFTKIRQNAQIQLAENTNTPIKGIKELTDAITNMRRLYFDMSTAERESPLGLALKRDIENAQKLKIAIDAYNRTLTGMSVLNAKDNANSSLGAYTELANILKTLSDEYKRLGREERNAAKGNDLADKIQRLSRATQKIQQQMNRPISFTAAMKVDEKTLDDIAYKMQRLRAYKQGIDLTKPNAANEIKQVDEALAKLQKDADKWMSKSNEMIKSNTALGRSWNYMKNHLAFYFTVGAGTQFVKNLIEVRSQYEMNERALGILINSAERGTQIFNELSQMALVSPYTLIELSAAAKQLTAYDVAAKDVVDTTRRLADMAAAVGIPIERLTYALGQIKAYGYLNARDARMFSNAGIPLVKQLAEHYTELEGKMVSTADVYDRIKKKAIDMTDVMQVINKMTDEGGKFFDFQAKMAGTLKVQLANLTLAWNNMLNDIGASEQGTISTGIGLLKELFLQWKNISKMVTNLAIGFGIVKVSQLAYYGVVMGTNKAIALETVLGNRLSNNLRSLASSTNAARMSSTALWVGIATFAAAAVVDILRGNEAMKEFNKTLRENAENTYNDLKKFSENYSGLRESLYKTENGKQTPVDINSEEAKKAWEVLREQIELSSHASDEYIGKLLSIENVSERLRQGFAMIESIQSVSAAIKELGDSSIKLERDWSEWWNLGLLPDGTIGNLQDAYMWLSKIEEKYGSVVNARKVASTSRTDEGLDNVFQDEAKEFVENYETELEKFRKDLKVTKQSIIDFIELKGWSGDTSKINEAFKTFTDNLILKNQLNPQQAYTLQLEMEEARSKAAKQAQYARVKDLERAYYIEKNKQHREELAKEYEKEAEIYNNWDNFNGRKKVEWERFTKWLKEQHISETTAMFRNMDAEDIRSLNFQEGKHAEWVKRMVTQYAKEHKMSYDDAFGYLKSWVTSANQWSIFIPMTISTENSKTIYKQLGEYDKAVDEADAQIARLTTRINELDAKKKKSKEETKELAEAEKELTQAQKDKADAEAKGGHGKKEKKDEKAANKAAKQAETELQKALKDELSTIEKVRSIYKDLTKEGMSHANAVERATRGWDETVDAINRVLQKNGLQKLDLSKFAGIENPRELVNMLQSQLNTLLKRGAKPAEIKELQTKVNTLEVDADKYDLTKITKGLNNELGKLKDEYELAVELDANPELGNMFTEMFGIDTSTFPKTIDEYMQRVQQEFDKMREKRGFGEPLNIFKADDAKWESWGRNMGLVVDVLDENGNVIDENTDALDKITPKFKEAQNVAKKWAQDTIKQTQDLQYKLADNNGKIAIEEEKLANLRQQLSQETNDKQKALLELQIQDQQNAINKLKEEILQLLPTYNRLFGEVAEHSAAMTRKLARDYKNMLVDAQKRGKNKDGQYTVIDPINGKSAPITEERLGKEIKNANKELGKTDNVFKKIKESLTKGEDGIVDWVGGIENIGEAIGQVGDLVDTIGNVYDMFGNPNEYDATSESLHDIATTMQGVNTAAKGIGQIASGDYIGGAMSVISGLSSAIGTWFDNGDKEILQQIKDSERAVKRLELAYIDLEHAINNAYGMATIGAQKAAIANKKLQLVELKRQLTLEQSRDSKNKDEERIVELQKQIKELEYDIKDATDSIVNDLLGISSVGDALEGVMSNIIDTFRNGSYKLKDIMKDVKVSFNDMIANMVMKMYTTKILEPWFEEQWNAIQNDIEKRMPQREISKLKDWHLETEQVTLSEWIANEKDLLEQVKSGFGEGFYDRYALDSGERIEISREEWIKQTEEMIKEAEKELYSSMTPTKEDILHYAELLRNGQPIVEENLKDIESFLRELGLLNDKKKSSLSALQQGIQGITEDTAGALEAYMNGVSQQVYLQSDLLTQIRDAVVGIDIDVQVATQAQMLLQLQQSYAVQMSIQGILEGVLVPSGRAFAVELLS